jgi:predicted transcriptional regulator
MATMTIHLPDAKQEKLRRLAERSGVSLNKLVEQWAGLALTQFDAEKRFLERAARGDASRSLALLEKLDRNAPARSGRQAKKNSPSKQKSAGKKAAGHHRD